MHCWSVDELSSAAWRSGLASNWPFSCGMLLGIMSSRSRDMDSTQGVIADVMNIAPQAMTNKPLTARTVWFRGPRSGGLRSNPRQPRSQSMVLQIYQLMNLLMALGFVSRACCGRTRLGQKAVKAVSAHRINVCNMCPCPIVFYVNTSSSIIQLR